MAPAITRKDAAAMKRLAGKRRWHGGFCDMAPIERNARAAVKPVFAEAVVLAIATRTCAESDLNPGAALC